MLGGKSDLLIGNSADNQLKGGKGRDIPCGVGLRIDQSVVKVKISSGSILGQTFVKTRF